MADITIDSTKVIKQIRTDNSNVYTIDAPLWEGHRFSDVESMIHGVVDTFVIQSSKSKVSGYDNIVGKTDNVITLSKTVLDGLVDNTSTGGYKVGDIILIQEATTESKLVFDRWVSNVTSDNIELTILETQVATHHHTIDISTSASTGLSSVKSAPSVKMTGIGSAVSVITSATGTFVTSVDLVGGSNTLELSSSTTSGSGIASHSHTVNSHSHTFKPNSLVSTNASAYITLTSQSYTPHTHTVLSAAGKSTDGTAFTVATGVSTSDTFIKTLKDSGNLNTGGTTNLTTNNNTEATTSSQSSTTTSNAGDHTHDVSVTTTNKVVTSVSLTKPNVATSVVTSVSWSAVTVLTSFTASGEFLNSWSASVDSSGILSFSATSGSVVTTSSTSSINSVKSAPRSKQDQGSLTVVSANVTATGTAETAGSHNHGFSHTHTIPAHSHSIESHTHTYVKSIVATSANAITSLSTSSYTPHTHAANIGVASTASDGTTINVVTGGSQTTVVATLKTADFSTNESNPGTDTKHTKLIGSVIFPGLTAPTGSVSTSSTTVTPAVAGTINVLTSISFNTKSFVTSVTSGSINTSVNKPGKA